MLRIKFIGADMKMRLCDRRDFSTINRIFLRKKHIQIIRYVSSKKKSNFYPIGHRCQVAIQHSLKIRLPSCLKRSYKQRKMIKLWVATRNISSIVLCGLLRIFLKMRRHVDLGTIIVGTEIVRTECGHPGISCYLTLCGSTDQLQLILSPINRIRTTFSAFGPVWRTIFA